MNAPSDQTDSTPGRVERRVTSHPAEIAPVRRAVEALAVSMGFGDKAVGDIGLCVNEAMANVTRHAYEGRTDRPVWVIAEAVGNDASTATPFSANQDAENSTSASPSSSPALQVTIRDWGNGMNPVRRPPQEHDPLRPGGLGLVCLRSLIDDVVFAPQPDGMLLTLVKRKD